MPRASLPHHLARYSFTLACSVSKQLQEHLYINMSQIYILFATSLWLCFQSWKISSVTVINNVLSNNKKDRSLLSMKSFFTPQVWVKCKSVLLWKPFKGFHVRQLFSYTMTLLLICKAKNTMLSSTINASSSSERNTLSRLPVSPVGHCCKLLGIILWINQLSWSGWYNFSKLIANWTRDRMINYTCC